MVLHLPTLISALVLALGHALGSVNGVANGLTSEHPAKVDTMPSSTAMVLTARDTTVDLSNLMSGSVRDDRW